MAIALVQSAAGSANNNTVSLAYSGAVTPGNTLIAAIGWPSTSATITVSDNQFGSWTSAVTFVSTFSSAIYYLPSVASANVIPTVTISASAVALFSLIITEVSGLSTLVDQTGHNNAVTASINIQTSGATTNATEFVILTANSNNSVTWTAPTAGYTLISSNGQQGAAYAVTSTTGTQSANLNLSASHAVTGTMATFFPAGTVQAQPIFSRRYVQYNI